jgi:glutathione S-transferase
VRLALEAAGAAYTDVARLPPAKGGGERAIARATRAARLEPFAPPFLKHGKLVIAQTANILLYLGPRLALVPDDEASRLSAHQLELTIADLVSEVHDVHHPISSDLYYEDQKTEAKRRSRIFLAERVPRFLGYFERVLDKRGGGHFVGRAFSYVDFSAFQVVAGLTYAFPCAMRRVRIPRLRALSLRVAEHAPIARYLASPRRIPFDEGGIFRHYPELDHAP